MGGVPEPPQLHNFHCTSQSASFRSDADSVTLLSRSVASTPETASAAEGDPDAVSGGGRHRAWPGSRLTAVLPVFRQVGKGGKVIHRKQSYSSNHAGGKPHCGSVCPFHPIPAARWKLPQENCNTRE